MAVFVSYVEASEDATVTKNIKPQTYACIEIGPSENLHGIQKVFEMYTGRILKGGTIR